MRINFLHQVFDNYTIIPCIKIIEISSEVVSRQTILTGLAFALCNAWPYFIPHNIWRKYIIFWTMWNISAHIYGIIYFGWGKLKLVVYLMQLRSFDFSGTSLWCAKYLFPEISVTCLRRMHVCFNLNFYDYSWPSGYELLCL